MNQEQEILVNRLTEAGLSLRRFIQVGPTKAPIEPSNWQNNLHTPDEMNGSEGWGVVGRDGLVLIDTDDERMAKEIGETLPKTFVTRSGNRGLPHFYYHVDGEVPNRVLKFPGETTGSGELRAQNHYLVAPGTEFNGKRYTIMKDRPIATLEYPTFMDKINPLLGTNTEQPITREAMVEGVPQGTRHHYGIRYATRLIGIEGLDRAAALDVLRRWNQKNNPPMAEHDLERMITNAIGYVQPETPSPQEQPREKINDKYITDSIIERHKFYCDKKHPNSPLYIWQAGVWDDSTSENTIIEELSQLTKDEDTRTLLRVERTTTFIKGIHMNLNIIEKPPNLLNFKNGLLDINTMELLPHDPKYFTVNQIPHNYNPDDKPKFWLEWLSQVLYDEDIAFMQEWMGYNFYDKVPEAAFTVLTGLGQNGKTIFMDLLTMLLGEVNVSTESFQGLTYGQYSMAELYQKIANISDEIGGYMIKDSSKIKTVSAGSRTSARGIYGKPFPFYPYAKLTFACNVPPEIKDMSDAIKMRLKFIEFPFTFSKDPQEGERQAMDRKELMMKLHEEREAILNWGVIGLKRLVDNGFKFTTSRSTEETFEFYRKKSTPIISFVEEGLMISDDDQDKITIEGMYAGFNAWLRENGIKLNISRQKMIKDLKDEGVMTGQRREDNRKRMYYGVTLSLKINSPCVSISNKEETDTDRGRGKTRVSVTPPLDEYGDADEPMYRSPS